MLLRSGLPGLVSVMSACVLPISPEFQDPPAAANFSPVILSATPDIGSIVTATSPSAVPMFQVFVSDPNLGDDLHVRWIADFPPFTPNTRVMLSDFPIPHRSDGKPIADSSEVVPNCLVNNLAKIPQHQIMAVVADRLFDDSPTPMGATVDLTRVQGTEGRRVIATWTLNLDCP
jgi:hypothetical protein